MNIFTDLLEIYGRLSGFKFKSSLTSSKFGKLHSFLNYENLKKHDYDLIFKKVISSRTNQMDFEEFISAIEEISKRVDVNFDKEDKYASVRKLITNIIQNSN